MDIASLLGNIPQPDFSNPSKAIESYWRIDKEAVSIKMEIDSVFNKYYLTDEAIKRDQTSTKNFCEYDHKKRIVNIDEQSPDTAIVYIEELRFLGADEFDKCRIYVRKIYNEWRLEKKERVCFFCQGTGSNKHTANKKEPCHNCLGAGWQEDYL